MHRVEVGTPSGPAWVDIDKPSGSSDILLVLGHGAGGGVETPDLVAVRDAAILAGITVARVTQPYRVAGRKAPAPAPRLDEAWIAVVGELRTRPDLADLTLVQGGRSSGARVACRTAAATSAVAVIALAFPVHPPGRPERTRLDELDLTLVPTLVVQGDRDAFGMPPPGSNRQVVVIPGADHSLKRDVTLTAQAVLDFVARLRSA